MSSDRELRVSDGSATEPRREHAQVAEAAQAPQGETAGPDGDDLDDGGERFRGEVRTALAVLTARLDRDHDRAAHREAIIDRLHEENQRLRRGELQELLEPVRAALYRLHDQARRESERWSEPAPPAPAHAARLLAAVADDVADVLARIGAERFAPEPGEPYDASRHRPVAVTPVTDPGRAGTVVGVQAHGFEQGDRVLRKAAVHVGKLATDPAETVTSDESGTSGLPGSSDRAARGRAERDDGHRRTLNTRG
ncbi:MULTISPECIES: nucleotide exchange factor GrpE [Thermomonosporaceae]|uniref:nucleotide exchange factor GrpE n=1 Tax=Thermomonosporaceae TaxID=2012 RepID=UPI00255B1F64|nr:MULTISPECIES: nucleotide exchange factor GrpE [Thermomonosporaceae]MDL4774598.1 nucleotide exchange factor GrpE [Actinomadura xylanilytica]